MAKREHEAHKPEMSVDDVNAALSSLLARGLVEILPEDLESGTKTPRWRLTEAGLRVAQGL